MASKNISNNVLNVSKESSDLATDDNEEMQEQAPTLLVTQPTAVVTQQTGDTGHYQSSSDMGDTSGQVLMVSMSVFSVLVLIVIATGCSIGNTQLTG